MGELPLYGAAISYNRDIVAARRILQQGRKIPALLFFTPAPPLPKKSLQSKSFLGALFAPISEQLFRTTETNRRPSGRLFFVQKLT